MIFRIVLTVLFWIAANFIEIDLVKYIIFILAYLIIGYDVLSRAIKNILRGEVFDENFLMSIATIGAIALKEFPEAIAVMLFYQIGETFQDYAVNNSRKSITKLMEIRPDFANIKVNDKLEKVNPENVKIGDIIFVKPGEKVPLDGIVRSGNSMLDTKTITGESVPRSIEPGCEILSGTINLNSLLEIEVTKGFEDSTVNKILELVENATSKKSKSEKFITKFAKFYTPIVVFLALAIAVIPPLVIGGKWVKWISRALIFLVISCPCALVISIPLSFFGGIGGASKKGILIKGSNYLEALSNTKVTVFDKTGTLTKGVFKIQKINSIGLEKDELLKFAAYTENYSNHPIALSIKQEFKEKIDEESIKDITEISGKGIKAVVFGKEVLVGNEKLLNEENVKFEKTDDVGTIVYIAIDKKFSGYILISDELKENTKETIDELKKSSIKTVMLTGDRNRIAEKIKNDLGIDEFYSELLPEDKLNLLEEIIKNKGKNEKVAFIGDGVNDSPVLARADIGIAMGGIGADSAIEASDIVIMTDEINKIIEAIKISKKTLKIVRQNIIFAIGIKVAILILGALGLANMWMAVFADVGVSIIAILNAMRALKIN